MPLKEEETPIDSFIILFRLLITIYIKSKYDILAVARMPPFKLPSENL
jgi:hypothetical protein